jgi:hypothetical protein
VRFARGGERPIDTGHLLVSGRRVERDLRRRLASARSTSRVPLSARRAISAGLHHHTGISGPLWRAVLASNCLRIVSAGAATVGGLLVDLALTRERR